MAHPLAYQLTDNLMSPTNIDMDLLLNQAMHYQKKSENGQSLKRNVKANDSAKVDGLWV